jgi:hypothetical protein
MRISKGLAKAEKILSEMATHGCLVDVYSKGFFERQPSAKEDSQAPFLSNGFENILKRNENNRESNQKPVGHLLFVFLDEQKSELIQAFSDVYSPLKNLLANGKHKPDFLILNLYTQQMLCVGLGRKNQIFIVDAGTGEDVDAFGLLTGTPSDIFGVSHNNPYMVNFIEHDVCKATKKLIIALDELGASIIEYKRMSGSPESIENSLSEGPNSEGVYVIKDCDGDVVDEGPYTKEDLNQMLKELKKYVKKMDESMKTINAFFPQCDRWDLDTDDY